MIRVLALLLGLLLPLAGFAAGPAGVRKQVEASMLLTGTIVVNPQGEVEKYAIDQADKVPQEILGFVSENIEQWRFEPVMHDGKPISVHNQISVLLVAKRADNGNFAAHIAGTTFHAPMAEVEAGTQISSHEKKPPQFPMSAAEAGVQGTVYLVIRAGRDGKVMNVVTEQVNLKLVASEEDMRHWRAVFAKASRVAARDWTFTPPSKGEQAARPFWTVRVPVDYKFVNAPQPKYGEWDGYVPGPRETIPWQDWYDNPGYSPDAGVADGRVYPVDGMSRLRLLTPLSGS